MKRPTLAVLALFLVALAASAATTNLYDRYENVRQALLKNSLPAVQTAAGELASVAKAERQNAISTRASALAAAADLKAARDSFAMLSDELIAFRDAQSGKRPVVVYCSMEKKSWLQPKGKIGNPYAPEMQMCGELKSE